MGADEIVRYRVQSWYWRGWIGQHDPAPSRGDAWVVDSLDEAVKMRARLLEERADRRDVTIEVLTGEPAK